MKWLLGIALSAAVAMPAMARDALDFATLESGKIRRSVDLSAFAPPADATPPSHQFEGRLTLSGKPSMRSIVADHSGNIIRDSTTLEPNNRITVSFHRGRADASVISVHKDLNFA